jgi:hypothetical protein
MQEDLNVGNGAAEAEAGLRLATPHDTRNHWTAWTAKAE